VAHVLAVPGGLVEAGTRISVRQFTSPRRIASPTAYSARSCQGQ
jgi:hypothetical protein